MDRRTFLKTNGMVAGASLLGLSGMLADDTSARGALNNRTKGFLSNKPNILMITCHDLGQHLGCYGIKEVKSPNIDALAARGVRFSNMFSTSAVCSPARGALHTGCYPQSNGLMGLTHAPWWWRFNKSAKHIAAILGDNGYESCLCGLQHIFGREESPKDYGYHNILTTKTNAEHTVKLASDFLKQRPSNATSFFLKVGFREVHRLRGSYKHMPYHRDKPVFIPPYLAKTPIMREDLGRFQENIKYFDDCVGRILKALKSSPHADNTIVVFTSDHGIAWPGGKWTLRDSGIKVPLVMYYPNSFLSGGKVYENLVSHVDVLPSLLDMIGIRKPSHLEGVSFAAALKYQALSKHQVTSHKGQIPNIYAPRKEIYAQFTPAMFRDNESRCIRTERYKLIWFFQAGRCVIYPIDTDPIAFSRHTARAASNWKPRPFVQLFDIQKDPNEFHDIARKKENALLIKELSRKLYAWMQSVNDPILKGAVQSPYYRQSIAAFSKIQTNSSIT